MDDENCKDDWTRAKIHKLIELYKSQDCLWNIDNPSYRDKRRRIAALKVIATTLGFDVMNVERKLKVLKTQFMHCYKIYKKYSLNGESYQPKWFAYHSLKFLIPAKIYRENREISRIQKNIQGVKSEAIDIDPDEIFKNSVVERSQEHRTEDISLDNTSLRIPTPRTPISNNPSETRLHSACRTKEMKHPNDSWNENGRDEYSIFGELVACRLRKLRDPKSRLTLQFNINNLIFDAEMQEIDRIRESTHALNDLNGMECP